MIDNELENKKMIR